jgi:hypothetical protein
LDLRKEVKAHPAFALWVESERCLEGLRYRHAKKAEVVALRVAWLMENNNRPLQPLQQQQQQQLAHRDAQPVEAPGCSQR